MSNEIDTSNPEKTLRIQLETMRKGETHTVYKLATPSNRLFTANGGYDYNQFNKMVNNSTYLPLLNFKRYKILNKKHYIKKYIADIQIFKGDQSYVYRFKMSLLDKKNIDTHESLFPYQLEPNHKPVWRTDSVIRLQ